MATKSRSASAKKKSHTDSVESMVVSSDFVTLNTKQVNIQSGGMMKDKLIPFFVALVVIGAFVVGNLYGKVTLYEKGLVLGSETGNAAGQAVGNQPSQPQEAPAPQVIVGDQWDELLADAAIVKGDENADVTLVEFTDYQCPFCARFYSQTYDQLMKDYVDTGKVRYIMRDLPLSFHPNAKPAALAARCAGDQGKYFEMHDMLFETQAEWQGLADVTEAFSGYAADLGLNGASFSSCVSNGDHNDAIDADVALAGKVGATGTPSFFINGEKLVGAQPYATFQATIDAALEN